MKNHEREIWVGENRISVNNSIMYGKMVGESDDSMVIPLKEGILKLANMFDGVVHVHIDLNDAGKQSKKIRGLWSELSKMDKFRKVALYGIHPVAQIIASFAIGVIRKKDLRFFKTREEALAWLKEETLNNPDISKSSIPGKAKGDYPGYIEIPSGEEKEVEIKQVNEREIFAGKIRFLLDDEKIINIYPVGNIDKKNAIAIKKILLKLIGMVDGKVKIMADLNKAGIPLVDAKKVGLEIFNKEKVGKVAFFGIHPVARVIASFIINMLKKKDMCFFRTREEALLWLRE